MFGSQNGFENTEMVLPAGEPDVGECRAEDLGRTNEKATERDRRDLMMGIAMIGGRGHSRSPIDRRRDDWV